MQNICLQVYNLNSYKYSSCSHPQIRYRCYHKHVTTKIQNLGCMMGICMCVCLCLCECVWICTVFIKPLKRIAVISFIYKKRQDQLRIITTKNVLYQNAFILIKSSLSLLSLHCAWFWRVYLVYEMTACSRLYIVNVCQENSVNSHWLCIPLAALPSSSIRIVCFQLELLCCSSCRLFKAHPAKYGTNKFSNSFNTNQVFTKPASNWCLFHLVSRTWDQQPH